MELSPISFTGKTIKFRYDKKYTSPNPNREHVLNLRKIASKKVKNNDPMSRIKQALTSSNSQEAKRAIDQVISNPSLNLYV